LTTRQKPSGEQQFGTEASPLPVAVDGRIRANAGVDDLVTPNVHGSGRAALDITELRKAFSSHEGLKGISLTAQTMTSWRSSARQGRGRRPSCAASTLSRSLRLAKSGSRVN
jgi:hypothetical protein